MQNLVKMSKGIIIPQCTKRHPIQNLHISKVWFLFPVSFTIEYKVGIAEFYLYMAFGADLLKNVVTRAWKLPKIGIRTPLKSANYLRFVSNSGRRSDHISEPHARFVENRQRIVGVIIPQCTNRNQNCNLHITNNMICISGLIYHWVQSRHCLILTL